MLQLKMQTPLYNCHEQPHADGETAVEEDAEGILHPQAFHNAAAEASLITQETTLSVNGGCLLR